MADTPPMISSLAEIPQEKIGSFLVRAINNPNNQPGVAQIWLYYPMTPFVLGTPELLADLKANNWREVPPIYQTPLFTQMHDVITVHNTFGTDGKNMMLWTSEESAAYVERYPIALGTEMEFETELIETVGVSIAGMPTIHMLTPLPLPSSGMCGFILDLHNPDAKLTGHRMTELPEPAQQRMTQLQTLLRDIVTPRTAWTVQTVLHRVALDPVAYEQELNQLIARDHLTQGADHQRHTERLEELSAALEEVRQVIEMQQQPSYESNLKEVRRLMQDLARDYYEYHQSLPRKALVPLPELSTSHHTILPSVEHLRSLGQSFGSRVARSLWNTEESEVQFLETPNGARLAVRGENGHEQKALHQFIEGGLGAEGIKYMITLLAAYHEQTGAIDRKLDARVTLRQLLAFMGKGDHADDLDEQSKLMHYILYMARTWITALDKLPEQQKRRGRPKRGYLEYTPLFVLEALGSDVRGGIRIPDAIEFHLGKEYWSQMFGQQKHFFTLPTRLILAYDSKRQPQEICLAFYLANMINLNFGTYEIHFPKMLIQTGLRDQKDIDKGHDRHEDALGMLYALEQIQKDLLIIRAPHPDIDTALAVEYYTGKTVKAVDKREISLLSEETTQRIQNAYRHFQTLTPTQLRTKKREALKSLLERVTYNTLKFTAGPLIIEQIDKRKQGQAIAIEHRKQAQEAAQKRKRKGKKS